MEKVMRDEIGMKNIIKRYETYDVYICPYSAKKFIIHHEELKKNNYKELIVGDEICCAEACAKAYKNSISTDKDQYGKKHK
jgi:hypothetical protein